MLEVIHVLNGIWCRWQNLKRQIQEVIDVHRICLTWDGSLNWEEQKLEAVSQLRQKSQSRGTGQSLKGRFSLGEIEEGFDCNFPKVY